MNDLIQNGFFREANVVYLLLKHFSNLKINDKNMYIPKGISISGLKKYPCYTNDKCELRNNGLDEWKDQIRNLFKNDGKIDFNTKSTFDIELTYGEGISQIKSASRRNFFIEAKGDFLKNGKPKGIKKKIHCGLGQLIFATIEIKGRIPIGSNLCLAIPSHWEKTLRTYIDGNHVFKKLMREFGRKKTTNGLELCYFRFILVKEPDDMNGDLFKVLYLPKNENNTKLVETQILSLESN